jgi:uncharacterized protein (DUF433 family)
MEPITTNQHIESRPGVCGGRPCIVGTRIRVQDIYVCHELQGMTPDEIVGAYPSITLADVHAARVYFWDHCDEIKQEIKDEAEQTQAMKGKAGPGLLDRLKGQDAGRDDSVPS